ncbi:MAG: hypothetical protein KC420_12505, partial [Myxococcales bacterium]|nr:hypothetical protein [Myxococcales bacterium]
MRLALVLLSLGLVGAPTVAAADAPIGRTLFGNPVTEVPELSDDEIAARRADFEAMVEERGWIVADDVIGPPELFADPDPDAAVAAWDFEPHRGTMFLNFYGGEMSGGNNSALMQSSCFNGKITYPGYKGTEAAALAMIEIFASRMEPYGIRVVYEKAPPPELPYQMVMMGGRPTDVGLPNGVLGVSCSSDCGDRWWRDTTLAFTGASSNSSLMGTTALQEAAHAFGLAHIDGQQHIMYPYASSGTKVWSTECTPYNAATGPINCKGTHDVFCGGDAQNDDAE